MSDNIRMEEQCAIYARAIMDLTKERDAALAREVALGERHDAIENERDELRTKVGRLGRLVEQAEARVGAFRAHAAKELGRACDAEAERDALRAAGEAMADQIEHVAGGDPSPYEEQLLTAWRKATGRES